MKHKRLHLALIRCGIEFEYGREQYSSVKCFRRFTLVIHRRFVAFDLGLDVSRGVFRDELNTSHAEIAERRAEHNW